MPQPDQRELPGGWKTRSSRWAEVLREGGNGRKECESNGEKEKRANFAAGNVAMPQAMALSVMGAAGANDPRGHGRMVPHDHVDGVGAARITLRFDPKGMGSPITAREG